MALTRTGDRVAGEVKLASQAPEPGRFWIRYVPKPWEPPERSWVNLATGTLGEMGGARHAAPLQWAPWADSPLDDVLYLPPVPSGLAAARDELARDRLVGGTPVLIQLFPGETTTVPPASGASFVFDLLQALLERNLEALRSLPSEANAVWPLLPGLTDDPTFWEPGCRELAAARVRCVQALTPALTPADRRRLAEQQGGEEAFDALFHRQPPSERDFARVAHRHGLEPFVIRPLPQSPRHGGGNRRIGGALALAGEIWLRLGRPVETGQAFYRDARWVDRASHDLEALAREGNLGVLPISPTSRQIAAECAAVGESETVARLLAEYVAEGSGVEEGRRSGDD
jgi:hypothetical protein